MSPVEVRTKGYLMPLSGILCPEADVYLIPCLDSYVGNTLYPSKVAAGAADTAAPESTLTFTYLTPPGDERYLLTFSTFITGLDTPHLPLTPARQGNEDVAGRIVDLG